MAQSRRLQLEVTISDLELVITLLDSAAVSRDRETVMRCHRNALKAFMEARRRGRALKAAAMAEQEQRADQLLEFIGVKLAAFYGWPQGGAASDPEFEVVPGAAS